MFGHKKGKNILPSEGFISSRKTFISVTPGGRGGGVNTNKVWGKGKKRNNIFFYIGTDYVLWLGENNLLELFRSFQTSDLYFLYYGFGSVTPKIAIKCIIIQFISGPFFFKVAQKI